jgi:hypothetical protein
MSAAPVEPGTEWTFARILGLMDTEQRTGVLEATWGSGRQARIHVRRGYVVSAERADEPNPLPLEQFLRECVAVPEGPLRRAIRDAGRRAIPLAELVLVRGLASEDVLKRFFDQQVAEVLYELFFETRVSFSFLEERPRIPLLVTPLPVAYILKEAERRADVWPKARSLVGMPEAVYACDPQLRAEVMGYAEPAPGVDRIGEVGPAPRIVFYHVNGKRTVSQLARATGLGSFETYRALAELFEAGLVERIAAEGRGETLPVAGWLGPRLAALGAYLLLAGTLGFAAYWTWQHQDELSRVLSEEHPEIDQLKDARALDDLAIALEIFAVERGRYPATLEDLEASGIVPSRLAESLSRLRYERTGAGYRLSGE